MAVESNTKNRLIFFISCFVNFMFFSNLFFLYFIDWSVKI